MKHLNFLSNLLSLSLGSPCTDVSLDRRLTVGSPSGRYCSGLMQLVSILAILLTVGVGNVWGVTATFTNSSNGTACTVNGTSGMKVGTSNKGGAFTITVPANATKLTLRAAAWNGVSNLSLNITPNTKVSPTSLSLNANTGIANNTPFTLSTGSNEADYQFDITLSSITTSTTLTFTTSTTKRCAAWGAKYVFNPTDLTNGTITSNSAQVSWSYTNSTEKYEIYYSTNNSAPSASATPTISSATIGTTKSANITGLSAGTTYYWWVRSVDDYCKSAWIAGTSFTTTAAATVNVTGVSVSPTSKAILVGETFTVTPTITPANATDQTVAWTTSASGKASVNSSGLVTGVAAGTANITCTTTDGGYTATCATTVYSASVTSIVDEDGTDISGSGVTATISGRTLTASEGSTKYKFKGWKYGTASGTSIASSSSLSTTLTGTPTGNVEVIAEFYKPVTVTWLVGSSSASGSPTTSVKRGSKITALPSTPADNVIGACANKFKGWSATSELIGTGNSAPADLFTSTSDAGVVALTSPTTYRAVFATSYTTKVPTPNTYTHTIESKTWEGTGSQTLTSKSWSLSNNGGYYGYDATKGQQVGSGSSPATSMTLSSSAFSGTITSVKISTSGASSISATVGVSVGSTDFTKDGDGSTKTASLTSTNTEYTFSGSATGTITISWAQTSSKAIYFKKIVVGYTTMEDGTDYKDYVTECCTPLGSINGSVSRTVPGTATLTWSNVTGAEKYQVKVPGSSSHNDWTDATSGVSVTGLACGTAYTAYFRAIDTNGSHCAEGPESTLAIPAVSWTVTSTGITHATASSAIPSTTCSGFSTTISPATGYALPADITVTNATKSWNSSTGALTISSVTGNVSITITPTCISPVITADPEDADYYVGDAPTALSVTATLASGTRTYLWKVSTNGGSTWSDATGTNNTSSYSGASLSTASVGTLKFKCIVGNSEGGCTVESGVATITVANASYFPNGKTIFIQAHSTSAWTGGGCVKAWFHTSGGSETAQSTYWLFDATGGDAGKKLFATVVPASGDLPYLDIQRFAANCSDWWNKNGGCSYSDANGSNTVRSEGKHDDGSDGNYVFWNGSGVTIDLYGDPSDDDWASSLASFSDQGAGVWTATYENYAPANAAGESQDFKAKTNYNGWIGNTGSNNNATLDGMHVGSTYDVTATLDIKDHSLEMSKTFVKGTVHFNLQGHGLAISDLTNVTAGSKISAPSAPSATGYTFGGWYKEPACTNAWTFASDVVNETMTLYAKWTANVYTITKTFSNVANAGLPISFTYSGATTTALNSTFTVDATNFFLPSSIAVTMGGTPLTAGTDYTYNNSTGAFTFSAVITGDIVITASATAKLKSIAITTQPTTRKYFAGESFSSTGAVVTATMGDGSTKAVTASATWTPPATPLAAGTGLTVTASYTENAINMTATTTIDVYSVTVNKKNEDGDAISADGVTATWTVGTKALAASATSASKYVFKQWEVTGASIGSTSSANTTLSNPTANVVVNAVFWKPRTVKWSVNGNDSYTAGGATTAVAYNGTISAVPTAPADNTLSCTNKFMGWSTKDAGTTPKTTSYYDDLFTNASGYTTNITAATTTFYAVFAEVPDEKNWSMGTIDQLSSGSGYATYDGEHTVTGSDGNDYTYTSSNVMANSGNQFRGSSYCGRIYNTATLGRITKIELVAGSNVSEMKVYESATSISTSPGSGAITPSVDGSTYTYEFTGKGYFLIIQEGSHAAKANVTVYFGDAPYNYVTECDANIVKVTYNANGGATSCTNTTTDKTEDFTVCSSAPTRDYYTFAGWLCSADDEVYAANATIDADAIDADFTLTAQWTPVTYNITYELDGGTNNVGNPATYNVTTATITLQDPTKGHDRFDGWYDNGSFTGDAVTSIPVGSHGDITLYAKWATRHEIVFDADGATTTIYRADDEALNASVAGQGSIPANPSAPSACSSKVFVGWVAEEIDGETDDEPTFLDVTSKVNADKHYYAVWATSVGNSIAAVEDESFTGGEYTTYFGKPYGLKSNDKYVYKNSIWTSSDMTAGTKVKIKVKHLSNSSAATLTIALINSSGTVVTSTTLSTTANSNNIDNAAYSSNVELIATTAVTGYQITLSNIGSSSGVVILAATREVVATRSAYSTSCCATKVTLSQNSPEHGTIAFGKTSVGTCGGDKEVSLTITPAAGYQLSSYAVATGDGKVAAKSMSAEVVTNNNSSAAQNITLTFAEDANGAYDVTAAFSLMTVTSWAWTLNSAAIPDPLNLYVGQSARLDVAYTPAGIDASKKTYTRNKDNAYINWVGGLNANYSTISGRASTGENTTAVSFTHADGPETVVNVKVLPLPLVHFTDLVHGKAFADVVATIEANALSATKTTPTSDDWTTPNANTCEENHLHLVGWIREDWPALVAYLNGTGDAPTTVAITGAGNDGEGHAYFFAPGASINTQTFNGVTFYAVWAKVE